MAAFVTRLKEEGLVNFLRSYLAPQPNGERRTLRKLLLGLGIVPVSQGGGMEHVCNRHQRDRRRMHPPVPSYCAASGTNPSHAHYANPACQICTY